MEDRRFTDTELPVFSGEEEGWYRYIHIVQAIKNRMVGRTKLRRCSYLYI